MQLQIQCQQQQQKVQKYVSNEGETAESTEKWGWDADSPAPAERLRWHRKATQSLAGPGPGSHLSHQLTSPRHPHLPSASDAHVGRQRGRTEGTGQRPPVALAPLTPTSSSHLLPSAPVRPCSPPTCKRPVPPSPSSIPVAPGQHRPDPHAQLSGVRNRPRGGCRVPILQVRKHSAGPGAWLPGDCSLQPQGLQSVTPSSGPHASVTLFHGPPLQLGLGPLHFCVQRNTS